MTIMDIKEMYERKKCNFYVLVIIWFLEYRFTMHLDGFHVFINNTVVNVLGDIVQQLPVFTSNPLPMYCAPWINPVCIMGSSDMSNKIIYTTSEFETMQFIEIQVRVSLLLRL